MNRPIGSRHIRGAHAPSRAGDGASPSRTFPASAAIKVRCGALEKERSVDGKTIFEIGSITNVFAVLLLTDMAQRGEVSLDDPVAKYLPTDVHVPEMTLADLATHTSGLPLRPTNVVSKDPDDPYAGYSGRAARSFRRRPQASAQRATGSNRWKRFVINKLLPNEL
ncbi:MAG: serine hydrolase domain-containing protein [Chthoniobacterales bacterium]